MPEFRSDPTAIHHNVHQSPVTVKPLLRRAYSISNERERERKIEIKANLQTSVARLILLAKTGLCANLKRQTRIRLA